MISSSRSGLSNQRVAAFTLVELTATMAMTTILMVGMASAMMIASSALTYGEHRDTVRRDAIPVIDELAATLRYAVLLETVGVHHVRFHVADRGHLDAQDEIIDYSWDGVSGSPLIYSYNNGISRSLLSSVEDFSLTYTSEARELTDVPRVLMVLADSLNPTAQETARSNLMADWGYPLQFIDQDDPVADFVAATMANDVVYVHASLSGSSVGTKLNDLPTGKVVENTAVFWRIGLSSQDGASAATQINVVDTTHPITSGLSAGLLTICKAGQTLHYGRQNFAPDMQPLATRDSDSAQPSLMAVEVGGDMLTGLVAPARIVALPWGQTSFDFGSLNDSGLRILQRSLVWAAASIAQTRVHVTLRTDADQISQLDLDIRLLNEP